MATRIDFTQAYDASPADVTAMLLDGDYARLRAERTGALTVTVQTTESTDTSATMLVDRSLPADVPSFARSFVGDTLTVKERYEWRLADDGTAEAHFTASFSAPMAFAGSVTVQRDGDGSIVRTAGEIKASVPLIGGKVEGFAKDSMERYLKAEQRIGVEWLTSH